RALSEKSVGSSSRSSLTMAFVNLTRVDGLRRRHYAASVNREPMVFSAAGVVFGFVLGYMVANAGRDAPLPASAMPANLRSEAPAAAPAGAPATSAPSGGPNAALDPAEVRTLTSLAEKEKKNLSVRVELGNLLMDHGQEADAVRWYREALALDPTQNDVRVDMGACLVRAGKSAEAIAEFDDVLKRVPAH